MTKQIARLTHTGIAVESVRGTGLVPTFWLPRTDYKHDDKIQKVVDDVSVGVIEDSINSDVVQQYAEGEIGGRIDTESIGLIFKLLFGTSDSVAVSGQAGAYDHTFTVLQSAQHPTFTLSVKDPNSGTGFYYTLGAILDFDLNTEINRYCEYKFKYRANSKTSATLTPSYPTTQRVFLPQGATLKFASSQAGLAGATASEIKKFTMSVKKNVEDDQVLGNVSATDRLNKQFAIEGSFEMLTNDYTNVDNLLNNTSQYAEFKMTNPTTIGVSTTPSITLTFYKVEFDEVANKVDNNGFATRTIKYKAFYNLADAKMVQAVIRNTTASY